MPFSDPMTDYNPLLDIDTGFASYLNARTRSYKDHIVGGRMDYVFESDFMVKQKISGFSGWGKIYKNLMTRDIPNRIKRVFQSSDAAGPLKYPEIYDAVGVCCEKLQISLPTVYVRNSPNKYEIYSVSAEGVEPFIVATSGLIDLCTKEELLFLVGCECGHIQNNHCIFLLTAPSFGVNLFDDRMPEEGGTLENYSTLTSVSGIFADWVRLADVTSDRAGIICLPDPRKYPVIMADLQNKGVFVCYGREKADIQEIMNEYDILHRTPARSIVIPKTYTNIKKRIFAGMEFLSCELLYNWRADLNRTDVHTVNKQALGVRCEIILGAAKEGV